ncbi:MAG: hypothetical protein Q9199_001499 [Rusavskia elegans]
MEGPQKPPTSPVQELETNKKQMLPDVEPFFPYDRIVKLLVGPESECFEIHRNLVSQYPFFKAAYEGAFQESEGVLKLPEQDPRVVRFLIYWLYSGKLSGYYYPHSITPATSDLKNEAEPELWKGKLPTHRSEVGNEYIIQGSEEDELGLMASYRDTPFDSLIDLYLLAEYLQIPRLKDDIVNTLVDVYGYCSNDREGCITTFWSWGDEDRPGWAPSPIPLINNAWNHLPRDSHLCQLLITLFLDNGMTTDTQNYEGLDPSFLCTAFFDLQERWQSNESTTKWRKPGVLCEHHHHDGNPCNAHKKLTNDKK